MREICMCDVFYNMQKELDAKNIAMHGMQNTIDSQSVLIAELEEKLKKVGIVVDLYTPYGQTSFMDGEIK